MKGKITHKMVILVRKDIKMPVGKTAAMVAHASVEAFQKSTKSSLKKWKSQHSKKVVLKVKNLEELLKYETKAKKLGLKTALIMDAGKTVFKKPTITVLAIGPDEDSKIDKITGKLKIL